MREDGGEDESLRWIYKDSNVKILDLSTFSIHNSHCRFMYFLRCTPRSCRHCNMYPFIFEGESGKDPKIKIEEI